MQTALKICPPFFLITPTNLDCACCVSWATADRKGKRIFTRPGNTGRRSVVGRWRGSAKVNRIARLEWMWVGGCYRSRASAFRDRGDSPGEQFAARGYLSLQFNNFFTACLPTVIQRLQHQSISYKDRNCKESNSQQQFFSFVLHYWVGDETPAGFQSNSRENKIGSDPCRDFNSNSEMPDVSRSSRNAANRLF